ncbi:MAG: aminopeptidase [Planctomycetes bacterium]|nr:aminopeptidase [Planctomycetota bacterium]
MRAGRAAVSPRWARAALALALTPALAPAFTGCAETHYLSEVARGQAAILARREPVDDVLAEPGRLTPGEAERLRLVRRVRAFARERLGLPAGDQYATFVDTGGRPVAYNLSACLPDRFEPRRWRFPIVGEVEYVGYFSRSAAQAEAARLADQGWEVYVHDVSAYSTLGWFSDPVFSPMLRAHPVALAAAVIHELTHAALYVPGNTVFNESLAEFIGDQGARQFFAELARGEDRARVADGEGSEPASDREDSDGIGNNAAALLAEYDDLLADQDLRRAFFDRLYQRLRDLYAAPLPRDEMLAHKEAIIADALRRFEALRPAFHYRLWPPPRPEDLSNAAILLHRRYHADADLFQTAAARHGWDLRATLAFFQSLAEAGEPDIPAAARRALGM